MGGQKDGKRVRQMGIYIEGWINGRIDGQTDGRVLRIIEYLLN